MLPHGEDIVHVAVIFAVGVHLSAFFHGIAKLTGFRQRLYRLNLTVDMNAAFQRTDRIGGMFVGVICEDHDVNAGIQQDVKIVAAEDRSSLFAEKSSHFFRRTG